MTIQMMQVGVCFCENLERAGGRRQARFATNPTVKEKRSFREGEGGARNIRPLLRTRRLLDEIVVVVAAASEFFMLRQ